MSNKILDNGTILTLGLVGAVAAIGAAAKRGVYGSRATRSTKINSVPKLMSALNAMGFSMESVPRSRIRAQLIGGKWIQPSILEDRKTDRDHTHIALQVKGDVVDFALERGASTDTFNIGNVTGIIGGILQDALKNDVALHRLEDGLLVNDENGISIRIDGDEAEIMRRIEDADGNLTGMKDIGTFRVSDIPAMRAALSSKVGSRATAMVGDRFEWPRTNSYSFEEYRRNAGIRDMDEFRADLRRKMSDPRSDSSQNYAGVEHTPGAVPEYNRKPHATMKAAVAAATKLAKGGGRPVVHSVDYSGRIYTRYVDERGFGESLLEEFGSDRYPRPLPRKGGSRATSASKAPSIGEYDDFVVAKKSRGNKHAYYIEGHDGDLDDGWYYNSITWGVDLAGPYDNAAEALRKA